MKPCGCTVEQMCYLCRTDRPLPELVGERAPLIDRRAFVLSAVTTAIGFGAAIGMGKLLGASGGTCQEGTGGSIMPPSAPTPSPADGTTTRLATMRQVEDAVNERIRPFAYRLELTKAVDRRRLIGRVYVVVADEAPGVPNAAFSVGLHQGVLRGEARRKAVLRHVGFQTYKAIEALAHQGGYADPASLGLLEALSSL